MGDRRPLILSDDKLRERELPDTDALRVGAWSTYKEVSSAPDTPGPGLYRVYFREGKLYYKDDEGNEICIMGSSDFENGITLGRNGAGGKAGSITFCDGANPGTTETLNFAKWNSLNDTNGLVKGNGSGGFSAVTDNSLNWNNAYSHKLTEDAVNGLVKCNGAGFYSGIIDNSGNWNTAYGWGNHAAAGYVVGPGSAVDGNFAGYDGATGKLIKDSGFKASDFAAVIHANSHKSGGSDAIKLDDLALPDDNTDLNANTTNHGLLLKAVAPAANVLNVVGIANGETIFANKTLFDGTNPANIGTAAPGTSLIAAHRDHVHSAGIFPKVWGNLDTNQGAASGVRLVNLNNTTFYVNDAIDNVNHRWLPTVAGYYIFSWAVAFEIVADSTKRSWCALYKNGANVIYGNILYNGTIISSILTVGSGILYMNGTTDYVELYAGSDASQLIYGAAPNVTFLFGARLM